jgi:hypothetical protein
MQILGAIPFYQAYIPLGYETAFSHIEQSLFPVIALGLYR